MCFGRGSVWVGERQRVGNLEDVVDVHADNGAGGSGGVGA